MTSPRSTQKFTIRNPVLAIAGCVILLIVLVALLWNLWAASSEGVFTYVSTVAGTKGEFGETFGIASQGKELFVTDGDRGNLVIVNLTTNETKVARGLDTPSGICIGHDGKVIVADSGRSVIYRLDPSPTLVAGISGQRGLSDGGASSALFNSPVAVACGQDGKIFVADTYNDRIRVIENGNVSTLADQGFDTPTGLAVWRDKLLVADTGNRKIRVIEPDGSVWTLAGTGDSELKDGLLLYASFVQPTAIAVSKYGSIFVADGNAIRQINLGVISTVRTITSEERGLRDGHAARSRFNRPSGLAFDNRGDLLVADSENRLVRRLSVSKSGHEITTNEIAALRGTAEEFRAAAPPRWPFDPPENKRDIAGTLGEIRGEMTDARDQVWFHNGLDIAGAYGEIARFVRDEKVLRPIAVDNFGNLRESLRMPTLGYIHVRVARDANEKPFGDTRFLFGKKGDGVRIARGTQFKAGDAIGTLNSMNHVHLIAGRSGGEMNALDALHLPNLTDTRQPVIEKATLYDENWREIETTNAASRIRASDKVRVVVRAFDQVDGNAERRRLGVYKLGYQLLRNDGTPMSDVGWTIVFDRLPQHEAVWFAYANGSKSGATGETIFDYIVTNFVDGESFREGFLDLSTLPDGKYALRVFAADYFGNESYKDVKLEVSR